MSSNDPHALTHTSGRLSPRTRCFTRILGHEYTSIHELSLSLLLHLLLFLFFFTSVTSSSLSRMSPSLILTFSLIHQYPPLAISVTLPPRESLKKSPPNALLFTARRNLSPLEYHAVRGGLQQAASERVLPLPWLHLRRRVGHGAGHPGGGPQAA